MANKYKDIYDYILQEEVAFGNPISVADGWDWNFREHIRTSLFYKFGRLLTGNSDSKPVKNIVRPILNLSYRAEDINVKDVNIYVDDPERFHLSFLVKKYHDEVFVKKHDLDTFFDDCKEEKIDFGGSLVQNVGRVKPEVVCLQSICFCDQTNILSGPIAIKLFFSPSELKEMEAKGWGSEKYGATATIDECITLSQTYKIQSGQYEEPSQTPGKYIEVYQLSGVLPAEFLDDKPSEEESKYVRQIHFVTFYRDSDDIQHGITLFKSKDIDDRFKFISRDKIYNRALGFGGVEELFEPQVWTNYSEIRKKELIDSAAKTIFKTTDKTFAQRNKVLDVENMQVMTLSQGHDISQIDSYPRNINVFNEWLQEWENHAQRTGAATDPLLGEPAPSGTPFRAQERQVIEGKSLHEYRRGKFARFIEEIYQDWIIPYITKEIGKGGKFLVELSPDELDYVTECLVRTRVNEFKNEKVLKGEVWDEEMIEQEKLRVTEEFRRGGNKKFIEILKDELKDVELKVKVSVAGKSKDLGMIAEKMGAVWAQVLANPAILDDPRAAKVFGKIIEWVGLTPFDFSMGSQPRKQIAAPAAVPEMNQMMNRAPMKVNRNQYGAVAQ